MSMLTPPGMGGKYRITGDKYPRMRRTGGRRKLVLAATGGVLALGLVGWGTFQLVDVFTGGSTATAAGGKNCPAPATSASPAKVKPLPAPGRIKVNVLNATARSGLAKETADALKKRGFAVGEVGNATEEYDKKVKGTGLLLGPTAAMKTSLPVLGTQLTAAAAAAARLTAAGVQATSTVLSGLPRDQILAFAEREQADVIVVGASTRPAVATRLLGSTPLALVARSHRPVLVVTRPVEASA